MLNLPGILASLSDIAGFFRALPARLADLQRPDWLAYGTVLELALGLGLVVVLVIHRRLLPLVVKQARQRALSSLLTILSVALGTGLATGILILQRESRSMFAQADFGCDVIVGPKGSELQLVLNTIYQLDQAQGTIPWSVYRELEPPNMYVRSALPYAVGDVWKDYRVIGTLGHVLPADHEGKAYPANRVFRYRRGQTYELAEGRNFHPLKFEAVIGAEVAQKGGLKLGDQFQVQHGGARGDEHDEHWTVVGILKRTFTAGDKVIYIPLVSSFAIPEHEKGLEDAAQMVAAAGGATGPTRPATRPAGDLMQTPPPATTRSHENGENHEDHADQPDHDDDHAHHDHDAAYTLNPDGTIALKLTPDKWRISAVLVQSFGPAQQAGLVWRYRLGGVAMAVMPAQVMASFFHNILSWISQMLLLIAVAVSIVAGISILVSIYNSVVARRREIAILRALGATRLRILLLICMEAGLIGVAGGLAGVCVGHGIGLGASIFMQHFMGQKLDWLASSEREWLYFGAVVILSTLAGLVPALVAYRTPVATHLVAE